MIQAKKSDDEMCAWHGVHKQLNWLFKPTVLLLLPHQGQTLVTRTKPLGVAACMSCNDECQEAEGKHICCCFGAQLESANFCLFGTKKC
jgi:hypothetical protein